MAITTDQPEVDMEMLASAERLLPVLFQNSNGEINRLLNQLLTETVEKDKAYSLLLALAGSKLLTVADAAIIINRQPNKERALQVGKRYILSNPSDSDAFTFMDEVIAKCPELVSEMMVSRTDWNLKKLRELLTKYLYTKELWLALAKRVDVLEKKK